jgi:citrate lyase subunit beta/citryl-CoA lyase
MAGDASDHRSGVGSAGPEGVDVRSDLHVQIELRDSGGIDLDLTSRVEPYYGESIRQQARSTLAALGAAYARVRIDDKGALPFVIQARLEAAARRAGLSNPADARPERTVPLPPAPVRGRLRRSRLYLPGNEPRFMVNAALHEPDGVILDLEDSVHPAEKDAARLLVRNALRCVDFLGAERMVRINQLPLGIEDLESIVPEFPDLILVPKVETADQIREVDRKVGEMLDRTGTARAVWLMPILESALGVENALDIATASERVVALTIGIEDYTADLGVVKTREGTESSYARMRLVNAARAAGVQAIDSVYADVADSEGLREWAQRSRGLGFEGMGCIHPRQIGVIHQAYAPSKEEIEKALKILAAFAEAEKRGLGVVSVGSKMIDPPVVERARKLVETARAAGLVPEAPDDSEARES